MNFFHHPHQFNLECGGTLGELTIAYTTYGTLNKDKNNVVWICHALTANSNAAEWWDGVVGDDHVIDPTKYFIVCVNMPGSCYGSISPLDNDPLTDKPYYHDFPLFTTRDMARAYELLRKYLSIDKIYIGVGGSMGGQQLLEWSIEQPELFEFIFPIATNAEHSAWGVAFNASQRMCIENDETWKEEHVDAGLEGMKIARSIALISYRHYEAYSKSQQGFTIDTEGKSIDEKVFKAESYQRYQGEKLAKRFNAFSYYFLSQAMDKHNVGRGRDSVRAALQISKSKALVISISSDVLFPTSEQELLSAYIPNAQLSIIDSYYGHDGFLLEFETIENLVRDFISRHTTELKPV